MRLSFSLFGFFLLSAVAAQDVDAPAMDYQRPSEGQVQDWFLLGKVWGFLKYHHPRVTNGCLDWDGALLDRLDSSRTETLSDWLGRVDSMPCQPEPHKDVHSRADIAWLADYDLLGLELGSQLRSLETSSAGEEPQQYVTLQPGVGNPVFRNEKNYADLEVLDWRYRLLAVYRYWSIIEYWFPHRDLIADWDGVLREFIPHFHAAENEADYLRAIAAIASRVDDGHASFGGADPHRPPAGTYAVPFSIRFVEGRPFVGGRLGLKDKTDIQYAEGECLQYGDLIIEVDGRPVAGLISEWAPYYAASNESGLLRQISRRLLNGDDDIVSVVVERGPELLTVECLRLPSDRIDFASAASNDRPGVTFQKLSEDIAYLKLSTFDNERADNYIDAADGSRGLIIDIRGYPASFAVFELGRRLVGESTEFARFTVPLLTEPGTFVFTDPLSLSSEGDTYKGRLVILVDEASISQSEYTAMAFRSVPGSVVIGSQTAGADGNIARIPLPGGHAATITGIGVFYPDRSPTQQIGIVPDIESAPTIAGLRDRRDEVLESAISLIAGERLDEQQIRDLARRPAD